MNKLEIKDRLNEVIIEKEEAYFNYKTNNTEENFNKYTGLDKEMNELLNELVAMIPSEENITAPKVEA